MFQGGTDSQTETDRDRQMALAYYRYSVDAIIFKVYFKRTLCIHSQSPDTTFPSLLRRTQTRFSVSFMEVFPIAGVHEINNYACHVHTRHSARFKVRSLAKMIGGLGRISPSTILQALH